MARMAKSPKRSAARDRVVSFRFTRVELANIDLSREALNSALGAAYDRRTYVALAAGRYGRLVAGLGDDGDSE